MAAAEPLKARRPPVGGLIDSRVGVWISKLYIRVVDESAPW